MDEINLAHQRWRKNLFRVNILISIFIALVELGMYFVIRQNKLTEPGLPRYLLLYFFIPTAANFSVLFAGYLFEKLNPDSKHLNYIPSMQLAFICMVVAIVHYVFSVTLAIFCIPLLTTVIFSDRKMTGRVSLLCYVFLILSLVHRKFATFILAEDQIFWEEAIVAFAILIGASLLCNIVISSQEESKYILERSYQDKIMMQEQLTKDQKTGLYCSTTCMNLLDKIINSSEDQLSFALLDIDDFKQVNDTYGHLNGDLVISALTGIMKKYSDQHRVMSRFGGEEFVIVFSGEQVLRSAAFLESLRKEFEKQSYDFTGDAITVSIGLVYWKPGMTSEDLFNRADEAMYQAKSLGKNKVITAA